MNFAHRRSGLGMAKLLITTGVAVFAGDTLGQAPEALTPEPDALQKVRFISFVVPESFAGMNTAIRVRLASLHHPANPPPGTPDFTMHEGTYRYVNSFGGSVVCVESSTFATNYRCGTLGCEPEYRDWATDLSVETNPSQPDGLIHVAGTAVVPSSIYEVDHIAESCGFGVSADECVDSSDFIVLATSRWGDVGKGSAGAPDGFVNVIDTGLIIDNVKGLTTAISERRAWLKNPPRPDLNPIHVHDIGLVIDACKGLRFPYVIESCP